MILEHGLEDNLANIGFKESYEFHLQIVSELSEHYRIFKWSENMCFNRSSIKNFNHGFRNIINNMR